MFTRGAGNKAGFAKSSGSSEQPKLRYYFLIGTKEKEENCSRGKTTLQLGNT